MIITLAGQDITAYCDERKVEIHDTLAQGPGVQGGSTGRAATCKLYTSLGPVATAAGAGTVITTPQLVRMGEVIVKDTIDPTHPIIFGGYVGKLTDLTERTRIYSQVDCYDYWQHLDRFYVNKVYNGNGDVYIIRDLLKTYAPWIDTSLLPASSSYVFSAEVIKNVSVQKAIQKITDVTGYAVWVDYSKRIHYTAPQYAPAAPFSLSTSPNFISSFGHEIVKYECDDTAAVNRVTFYGGRKPSSDFTQDISVQATGTQTIFTLAYYPKTATDGKYHVNINHGPDLVIGRLTGDSLTPANKLKNAGGICDVLLNSTTPGTLTFSTPPPKGCLLTCKYRYELPLTITLIAHDSYVYFGTYLDGTISDETVVDPAVATQRCSILLAEQKYGLTTLDALVWKAGISAGQLVTVDNPLRGIHNQVLSVQEVQPIPEGGGQFKYKVSLGAWSMNVVDVLMASAFQSQYVSTQDTTDNAAAVILQGIDVVKIHDTWTHRIPGFSTPFYSRSVAVGDGHDAYPGFAHF